VPVGQIELAHITKMTLCCASSVLVNEPPLFTWVNSEYHMHNTSRLMGGVIAIIFSITFPSIPPFKYLLALSSTCAEEFGVHFGCRLYKNETFNS
jgi:hypothetical protein